MPYSALIFLAFAALTGWVGLADPAGEGAAIARAPCFQFLMFSGISGFFLEMAALRPAGPAAAPAGAGVNVSSWSY